MSTRLHTWKEYQNLPPWEQGFVAYTEAEQEGSELRGRDGNPYHPDTRESDEWRAGQQSAIQFAQDSEE